MWEVGFAAKLFYRSSKWVLYFVLLQLSFTAFPQFSESKRNNFVAVSIVLLIKQLRYFGKTLEVCFCVCNTTAKLSLKKKRDTSKDGVFLMVIPKFDVSLTFLGLTDVNAGFWPQHKDSHTFPLHQDPGCIHIWEWFSSHWVASPIQDSSEKDQILANSWGQLLC